MSLPVQGKAVTPMQWTQAPAERPLAGPMVATPEELAAAEPIVVEPVVAGPAVVGSRQEAIKEPVASVQRGEARQLGAPTRAVASDPAATMGVAPRQRQAEETAPGEKMAPGERTARRRKALAAALHER